MAKKITELPTLATADNGDLIPIVDISGSVTKKVTAAGIGAAAISGIPDFSIPYAKLPTTVWWEEIGRAAIPTGTATSMNATLIKSCKYLKIMVLISGQTGNATVGVRFNSDTGNNYAFRASNDGGTEGTTTSGSSIALTQGPIWPHNILSVIELQNLSSRNKIIMARTTQGATNASTVPTRRFVDGVWANAANQITTVTIFDSSSTSQFNAGSELIILGHD